MTANQAIQSFFRSLPQAAPPAQKGSAPPSRVGTFTYVYGDVIVYPLAGEERKATVGTSVYVGEYVSSFDFKHHAPGVYGKATIQLNDGTRMTLFMGGVLEFLR